MSLNPAYTNRIEKLLISQCWSLANYPISTSLISQVIDFKRLENKPLCMNNGFPKESHLPVTLMEGRRSKSKNS